MPGGCFHSFKALVDTVSKAKRKPKSFVVRRKFEWLQLNDKKKVRLVFTAILTRRSQIQPWNSCIEAPFGQPTYVKTLSVRMGYFIDGGFSPSRKSRIEYRSQNANGLLRQAARALRDLIYLVHTADFFRHATTRLKYFPNVDKKIVEH